jgi:hypothetical protein
MPKPDYEIRPRNQGPFKAACRPKIAKKSFLNSSKSPLYVDFRVFRAIFSHFGR